MQKKHIGFAIKQRSRLNNIDTQSVELSDDLDFLFETKRTSGIFAHPQCRIGYSCFFHD